jgi:hypothetical protein
VEAYQAMCGASFVVSMNFAADIGDVRRFDSGSANRLDAHQSRGVAR